MSGITDLTVIEIALLLNEKFDRDLAETKAEAEIEAATRREAEAKAAKKLAERQAKEAAELAERQRSGNYALTIIQHGKPASVERG